MELTLQERLDLLTMAAPTQFSDIAQWQDVAKLVKDYMHRESADGSAEREALRAETSGQR